MKQFLQEKTNKANFSETGKGFLCVKDVFAIYQPTVTLFIRSWFFEDGFMLFILIRNFKHFSNYIIKIF